MQMQWYGVRCLFSHDGVSAGENLYEERIILIQAETFEAAIGKAEREARKYTDGHNNVSYIGLAQAFCLFDNPVEDGAEVFSLMRTSSLSPEEYIDKFFETGSEFEGDINTE